MKKFSNLSTFKQLYNTYYSILKHNREFKQSIKNISQQYKQSIRLNANKKMPITKLAFQNFSDISCLARWGQVSDMQFGGSSTAEVYFNQLMRHVHLKGKINTSEKHIIQSIPFIGLLQKLPVAFKIGIFNCLRVKIIGDGHPVVCQMQLQTPIQGTRPAQAYIMTQKSQDWLTYEIPILNFQIQGQQLSSLTDLTDSDRKNQKISKVLLTDLLNPEDLMIDRISFRLQSSQDIKRQVLFKKIQLVRTIRGTLKESKSYTKPYFYLVDENQTEDQLLQKLIVGKYEYYRRK